MPAARTIGAAARTQHHDRAACHETSERDHEAARHQAEGNEPGIGPQHERAKAVDIEGDEDQRYVYRIGKDGKEEKRSVKVGRASGTKIEITSGLEAGDEVLQEKPAAKKPEGA